MFPLDEVPWRKDDHAAHDVCRFLLELCFVNGLCDELVVNINLT